AKIVGIKNVTVNEPFFQGHFPGRPVMPGVLVLEALAQAGGLLTQLSNQTDASGKVFYLVKIDNAKFSRMVVPGDRLELCVSLKRTIRNMALYDCVARVDGELVACAEILCAEVQEGAWPPAARSMAPRWSIPRPGSATTCRSVPTRSSGPTSRSARAP